MRARHNFSFFGHAFLSLSHPLSGAVAQLPQGCGGTLGFLDITSSNFYSPVYTCSGVIPRSGFQGYTGLVSSIITANEAACGDQCGSEWYLHWSNPEGLGATGALWFSSNQTCQCWYIGGATGDLIEATGSSESATYIDYFNAFGPPPAAENWGAFTCPEGSPSINWGTYGLCYDLTVIPAGPPLAQLGMIGGCATTCANDYNGQYVITDNEDNCNCYGDLAGLKYSFNFSSPYKVMDFYDFTPHPTSTSTIKSTSRTGTTSSKTSSKSSSTSSFHSTSSSILKPSSTSTSHLISVSTSLSKSSSLSTTSKSSSPTQSILKSTTTSKSSSSSKTTSTTESSSISKSLSTSTTKFTTTSKSSSISTSKTTSKSTSKAG
ncbi:hypothetical protein G7Y89_g8522 [Cudoniella acicularis]|uniref:WSC domain-containing protein n=1 Tax=Cudoniella acicularis TaxID=354080 RepID=A0A8H4W3H3_9HELO|nr:hypothetical protein G7Y89_g8522 [Cudoniella acicularis]